MVWKMRVDAEERPGFRIDHRQEAHLETGQPVPGEIAGFGREILAQVLEGDLEQAVPGRSNSTEVQGVSFDLVAPARRFRLGGEGVIGEEAGGIEPDIAVRAGDDIVPGSLEPAGPDPADEAVVAQGVLVAGDGEMGVIFRRPRRQLVQGVDRGDRVPAGPPCR